MQLKAKNGILSIYDDKAIIIRKGVIALSFPELPKETVFYFRDLVGIEYVKPNIINGNGYIRFVQSNTMSYDKLGIVLYSREHLIDPYSVVLMSESGKPVKELEKISNFVTNKIETNNKLINNVSVSKKVTTQ